jgi:hypothetical protein
MFNKVAYKVRKDIKECIIQLIFWKSIILIFTLCYTGINIYQQ